MSLCESESLKSSNSLVWYEFSVSDLDRGESKGTSDLFLPPEPALSVAEIWRMLDLFLNGRILDSDTLGSTSLGTRTLIY